MNENLHDTDDLFKKAIDRHEDSPSPDVWQQIDKNLDRKKVVSIANKYNKLKWIAAALLIFSAGLAMYTWKTSLNKQPVTLNNNSSKKRPANETFKHKNQKNVNSETVLENTATEKANEQTNKNSTKNNFFINENKKKNKAINDSKSNIIAANTTKGNRKYFVESSQKSVENKAAKQKSGSGQFNRNREFATEENSAKNSSVTLITEQKYEPVAQESSLKKAVALETEIEKQDCTIKPVNDVLQNKLAFQIVNNKMTTAEKVSITSTKNKLNTPKNSPFSVTVFYSPDVVSSTVSNNHNNFSEDERTEIKNKEKIKNAYSAGLLINFEAGKNFSLQSGLTFSNITTRIEPKTIYARPDNRGNINYWFNCSAGYSFVRLHSGNNPVAGESVEALSSENILQYIGVPVGIIYNISKGKISLNPGVGVAVNFLQKGKIETMIAGGNGNEKAEINHIEGLNKMYVNSALSAVINYKINENVALNLTPAARFALTSINKNAPFKTYLNAYGIAAGVTIKL